MYGVSNGEEAAISINGGDAQNGGRSRQLQLEVWSREREMTRLKASVDKLQSEVQRLTMMCEERRQDKKDLRQKWRKIEEFNAHRMELESVFTALIHANIVRGRAVLHVVASREQSTNAIFPVCAMPQNQVTDASDLIDREVTALLRTPDNRQYLLPAFPQGLLDARDFRCRRSICDFFNKPNQCCTAKPCREGARSCIVAVVESRQAFFAHKVLAANLLEELTKSLSQMQVSRDLVNKNRMPLASAELAP